MTLPRRRRHGGSIHTPGERMLCRADGQAWPCAPWREARVRADRAGCAHLAVIYPENPETPWRRPPAVTP